MRCTANLAQKCVECYSGVRESSKHTEIRNSYSSVQRQLQGSRLLFCTSENAVIISAVLNEGPASGSWHAEH